MLNVNLPNRYTSTHKSAQQFNNNRYLYRIRDIDAPAYNSSPKNKHLKNPSNWRLTDKEYREYAEPPQTTNTPLSRIKHHYTERYFDETVSLCKLFEQFKIKHRPDPAEPPNTIISAPPLHELKKHIERLQQQLEALRRPLDTEKRLNELLDTSNRLTARLYDGHITLSAPYSVNEQGQPHTTTQLGRKDPQRVHAQFGLRPAANLETLLANETIPTLLEAHKRLHQPDTRKLIDVFNRILDKHPIPESTFPPGILAEDIEPQDPAQNHPASTRSPDHYIAQYTETATRQKKGHYLATINNLLLQRTPYNLHTLTTIKKELEQITYPDYLDYKATLASINPDKLDPDNNPRHKDFLATLELKNTKLARTPDYSYLATLCHNLIQQERNKQDPLHPDYDARDFESEPWASNNARETLFLLETLDHTLDLLHNDLNTINTTSKDYAELINSHDETIADIERHIAVFEDQNLSAQPDRHRHHKSDLLTSLNLHNVDILSCRTLTAIKEMRDMQQLMDHYPEHEKLIWIHAPRETNPKHPAHDKEHIIAVLEDAIPQATRPDTLAIHCAMPGPLSTTISTWLYQNKIKHIIHEPDFNNPAYQDKDTGKINFAAASLQNINDIAKGWINPLTRAHEAPTELLYFQDPARDQQSGNMQRAHDQARLRNIPINLQSTYPVHELPPQNDHNLIDDDEISM